MIKSRQVLNESILIFLKDLLLFIISAIILHLPFIDCSITLNYEVTSNLKVPVTLDILVKERVLMLFHLISLHEVFLSHLYISKAINHANSHFVHFLVIDQDHC